MTYYIDTCILIPYYCIENISNLVNDFLLTIDLPSISNLVEIEFLSTLSKKYRTKNISKNLAKEIITIYKSHLEQNQYKKLIAQSIHYNQAKIWLEDFNNCLSPLDAMHLAISHVENLTLVTADKQLKNIAVDLKITTKLIP